MTAGVAFRRSSQTKGAVQGRLFETAASILVFVLGVAMQFNFIGRYLGLPTLRLSDAVVILGCGLLLLLVRPSRAFPLLVAAACVCSALLLSVFLKSFPQEGDTYFTIILMVSFIFCLLWINIDDKNERLQKLFSAGFLIGMALSTVVLLLRANHVDLTSIGLGTPRRADLPFDLASVKPGGIWSHGNEAGHVYALAAAPALYLSIRYRRPVIYALYFCLMLLTFTVTLNRGGLLGPVAGLIVAYVVAGRAPLLLKISIAIIGLMCIAWLVAHLPGLEKLREVIGSRLESDGYANENLRERFVTLFGGIKVAVANPFGIGFAERLRQVYLASGVSSGSSHNAFISLAYQAGLFASFAFIASVVRVGLQPLARWSLPAFMVAFAVPSMMFEELTLNPVFLFAIGGGIAILATAILEFRPHNSRTQELHSRRERYGLDVQR